MRASRKRRNAPAGVKVGVLTASGVALGPQLSRPRENPLLSRRKESQLARAGKWLLSACLAVLAVVSAFGTFFGPPWPTAPEVHRSGFDPSPLRTPFDVRNPSGLFRLTIASVGCQIISISPPLADGMAIEAVAGKTVIGPGESRPTTCSLDPGSIRLSYARIRVHVRYTNAWLRGQYRDYVSNMLTWENGNWTEGNPLTGPERSDTD